MKLHIVFSTIALLSTTVQGSPRRSAQPSAAIVAIKLASTSTTLSSTTPTAPPPVVNPWAADCPVPSSYTISSFHSNDGDSGLAGVTISYTGGSFTCPTNEARYNGLFDMNCDPDGLVRVITDAKSWIWVQEWYWCLAVPQPKYYPATLASYANFTGFAEYIECTTDSEDVTICAQTQPLTIDVQSYTTGGIIGYQPIDLNGVPLPQCQYKVAVNPVITDVATCTVTSTAAAAATP